MFITACLSAGLALGPGSAQADDAQACEELTAPEQAQQRLDVCSRVIAADPTAYRAYMSRGNAHSELNLFDAAIRDYSAAIRIDPGNARAFYNRALTYSDKGEHETAIQDFAQAISLDPRYAKAYGNRGYSLLQLRRYQAAIADLNTALSLDPSLDWARRYLDEATQAFATASTVPAAPPAAPVGGPARCPGRCVALVIGNGAYLHTTTLPNAPNDAQDVAAALRALDFAVELRIDMGVDALDAALQRFQGQANGADVALIFYAGHGTQDAGRNYLIPVDAKLERRQRLAREAIAQQELEAAAVGAKLQVILLDACRNNTFALADDSGAARGEAVRGLARVGDVKYGVVVFATEPDDVASDGTAGGNSPFTAAFLDKLPRAAELDLARLFGAVREAVIARTNSAQKPELILRLGEAQVYLVTR